MVLCVCDHYMTPPCLYASVHDCTWVEGGVAMQLATAVKKTAVASAMKAVVSWQVRQRQSPSVKVNHNHCEPQSHCNYTSYCTNVCGCRCVNVHTHTQSHTYVHARVHTPSPSDTHEHIHSYTRIFQIDMHAARVALPLQSCAWSVARSNSC